MVYDGFCDYFLFICQVDYQGDLVIYFTMLMPKNLIKQIIRLTNVKNIHAKIKMKETEKKRNNWMQHTHNENM
jgi:hypothetical protein